jgi:hypothetical protein
MAIYEFNGFKPVVKASSFVHPLASVTGNVIIGENGKVVYYDYSGLAFEYYANPSRTQKEVDKSIQDMFAKKIAQLLNNVPAATPAKKDGKPVPFMINNREFFNSIVVKNGSVKSY